MNWRIISTLVSKDVVLFFRNRFFTLITVLALGAYAAIYFLMPQSVDETLEIGLYAPAMPSFLAEQMEAEGLILHPMDSEEALKQALADGQFDVGVALPADMMLKLAAGQKVQARVYLTSDLPEELGDTYVILLQELAFTLGGQPLNLEISKEILGRDMVGMQTPPRDRLLPLLAIFILVMETMGLANLISAEVEAGTLQALLVTPLRVEGLFLGKGITGVSLAFVQAALLMAVTGGLSQQPVLVLTALLLGALLVTGVGFLMSSAAKDMMSVIAWGVLALLVLSIPSFGVMFPGVISDWVKVIPSYYLVDTVYQAVNLDAGWSDVWPNLLMLLAFAAAMLGLGVVFLRRKFR
jgi:ABC-2 type transport system permease protein